MPIPRSFKAGSVSLTSELIEHLGVPPQPGPQDAIRKVLLFHLQKETLSIQRNVLLMAREKAESAFMLLLPAFWLNRGERI